MTSQILKYVDFTKTQKSRYFENKIHKLRIKGYFMAKNNFVVEVTFKFSLIARISSIDKSKWVLVSFISTIYKGKCGTFTKWESVKETLSANRFFEKIWEVEALFWNFAILASL